MTVAPTASPTKCPYCGRQAVPVDGPFCSRVCRDRDLLNWLSEGYRLPVREPAEPADSGLDSDRIAD